MKSVRNSLLMKTTKQTINPKATMVKILTLLVASTFLMACSDDKHVAKVAYEVEIVNLTHNQPFSPLALRAHGAS